MPQNTVSSLMPIGVPGMLADLAPKDILSTVNEEATDAIPFGVMVQQGTIDGGGLRMDATTNKLRGVSIFGHYHNRDTGISSLGILPGEMFDCANYGRVLVLVEEDVTPDSEVHVRCVATGNEVAGAFRDTADGTDTIDVSAFARYRSTTSAGGLATLDIDLRNSALAVAD